MPYLHKLAQQIGKDHALALSRWQTGIPDAVSLTALIDPPEAVSAEQMESWVGNNESG